MKWWAILIIALACFIVGIAVGWLFKRRIMLKGLRAMNNARYLAIEKLRESGPVRALLDSPAPSRLEVQRVSIENFKNIEKLEIELMMKSSLNGNWTCIAGINGAGKSAILQALCIVILGENYARELGATRLKRMIRRTPDGTVSGAKIEAWVRLDGGDAVRIALFLNGDGIDEVTLHNDKDYARMKGIWDQTKSLTFVSYGAARNLSQEEETRHESAAVQVQRQMTLFDPMTRVADVRVLVKSENGSERVRRTLERLMNAVIPAEELGVSLEDNRLLFGRTDTKVDAVDQPDGFRSTIAWLADYALPGTNPGLGESIAILIHRISPVSSCLMRSTFTCIRALPGRSSRPCGRPCREFSSWSRPTRRWCWVALTAAS